jgi:hypothetical protein
MRLRPNHFAPLAPLAAALALSLVSLTFCRTAYAQAAPVADPRATEEWFDADDRALEDAFEAGDLDEEDLARRLFSPLRETSGGRAKAGVESLFAGSWVSVVGFSGELPTGIHEAGGFVVVGLALDKLAQGKAARLDPPRIADDTSARPAPTPTPPSASSSRASPRPLAIDAALARGAVRSAWRVSGIGASDAKIDDLIARSRLSVLLPEMRLRAMQVFQDGEHTTSYINESGTIIDTSGSTTTVEARLTWRLDRLLFAGDEPTLERVRIERQETRSRIGARVLELLFAWQRALLDAAASDTGSRAEADSELRACEAEISLDVMTAGWFGEQPAVRRARSQVLP